MRSFAIIVLFVSCIMVGQLSADHRSPVNMANGIKVGEVDCDSAIVWTRLTVNPERNIGVHHFLIAKIPANLRIVKRIRMTLRKWKQLSQVSRGRFD